MELQSWLELDKNHNKRGKSVTNRINDGKIRERTRGVSVLRLPEKEGETPHKNVPFLCSLPCTVSAAVVFSSPHAQVYSPASLTSTAWTSSCAVVPFCLIVYFSLGLSTLCFFLHSTEAALDSSHWRVAVPPSVASSSVISFWKRTGRAEGFKRSRMCDHGSYSSNQFMWSDTHRQRAKPFLINPIRINDHSDNHKRVALESWKTPHS